MNSTAMPILDTDRLMIRPFRPDDLETVFHIIDCDCFGHCEFDDETAKHRRREWLQWNIAAVHQQANLGHPPFGERAIERKSDGLIVGVCGLVPSFGPFRRLIDGDQTCLSNSPEFGLFYAIGSQYRRQKYATESARRLVQFAFESLGIGRIISTTEADNVASIGVMQQLGFTIHGNETESGAQVVGFLNREQNEQPIATVNSALELTYRLAAEQDLPNLARMNRQLIEDEFSPNPMSITELEHRMAGWLNTDWKAALIERNRHPVGYLLFQFRRNEYQPDESTVYVRQFFVAREHRGLGVGRRGFALAMNGLFSNVSEIVLDVLEANPQAQQFWRALGFLPYCTTMKRQRNPQEA